MKSRNQLQIEQFIENQIIFYPTAIINNHIYKEFDSYNKIKLKNIELILIDNSIKNAFLFNPNTGFTHNFFCLARFKPKFISHVYYDLNEEKLLENLWDYDYQDDLSYIDYLSCLPWEKSIEDVKKAKLLGI